MRAIRKRTGVAVGLLTPLALLLVAAVALATVTVYKESFGGSDSVRELKRAAGSKKQCAKRHTNSKQLRVAARRGGLLCAYAPPVLGDSAVPDHEIQLEGRVLRKQTPKSMRASTYIAARLRVAGNSHYELQVFPKRKRFRLLRTPAGAGFPVAGRSDAIKPLGRMNKLKLRAFGARVVAWVNGTRLALVEDAAPGQVAGRKLAFGVGSNKKAKPGPIAVFDDLRVRVPSP